MMSGRWRVRALLAALMLLSCSMAVAAGGIVTKVTDGDTIEVGVRDVRLQGIDAPESDQPHGRRAAATLEAAVLRERVELEIRDTDRYGRLVAVVRHDGRNINRWLVAQGYAWEYDRYSDDPALGKLEGEARAADRGLWAASSPIPPWEWRQGRPRPAGDDSPEPDRDCSDFTSHRSAQQFYEAHQPGDPHRMDGDGDGRACESLR